MAGQRVESKRRSEPGGTRWLAPLIGGLLLGLALGLFYAWVIDPAEPSFALPSELGDASQDAWITMVADSYALDQDLGRATQRLQTFPRDDLIASLNRLVTGAQSQGDLAREERLRGLLAQVESQPIGAESGAPPGAPDDEGGGALTQNLGQVVQACGFGLLALVLLAGLAVVITRLREGSGEPARTPAARERRTPASARDEGAEPVIEGELVEPFMSDRPTDAEPRAAQDEPVVTRSSLDDTDQDEFDVEPLPPYDEDDEIDVDALFADTEEEIAPPASDGPRRVSFVEAQSEVSYSPAFSEYVSRYEHGEPIYSTSFPIETDKMEFLGECGVGVLETLDDEEPQKVNAFELWLFDKNSLENSTAVLMSDALWQDQVRRDQLRAKGTPHPVRNRDTFDLESESLRVRVRVREVEFGDTPEAEAAYFERFVVELTAQRKSDAQG